MDNFTLRKYFETNSKYSKLKKRFDRKVKSGDFYELSTHKQRNLLARLRKLFEKLLQLKRMLKLAAAGATIGMVLTAGQANAQDFKMQKPFNKKFITEQQSPKGFESDIFIQMNGLNNPLGGKNPFSGILINEAQYSYLVDIDNDGDLDVFTPQSDYPTSYDYKISYLKNTGSSASADLVEQSGADNPLDGILTNSRAYMSFVDIDNDNDYDLFINDQYQAEILFYKNTGTPESPVFEQQFDAENPLDGENPYNIEILSFADIDDDGDLDFLFGYQTGYPTYSPAISLYKNTGTPEAPAFTPEDASPLFNIVPSWFESIILSDIDGDNDFDILLNGYEFFENTGNSTTPQFENKIGSENPFNNIIWLQSNIAHLIDNDNDGDLDLFVGMQVGVKYYENIGSSTYPYFKDENGIQIFNYVNDPEFADIDGDGDYDMFAAGYDLSTYELKVHFIENVGTPENPEFIMRYSTNNPLNDIELTNMISSNEFVDIDGDGDLDLFMGSMNSPEFIRFFKNIGSAENPVFVPVSNEENPLGTVTGDYPFISFLDIDNDGDSDLFIGDYSNARFFKNTGTNLVPEFVEETSPITIAPTNPFLIPDFVDIDNDGDFDLFAGTIDTDNYSWHIIHFLNQGTPEVPDFVQQTSIDSPLEVIAPIPIPAFVDIDNDSDPDCFVGVYGGSFLYFKNKTINVSVENVKENSFKLYPNPTNGIVTFESNKLNNQDVTILITDVTGKQMSNFEFVDYNKIDLSNLNAGIYFIRISDGKTSEVSKIVVQ